MVFGLLYKLNSEYSTTTVLFFGFAENKETEINLDHPVEVNKIYVTPGQKVKQGDLLAEVTHANLEFKLNDVSHEIAELQVKDQLFRNEIKAEIRELEAKKMTKEADTNAKIKALESELALNKSLVKDLKSLSISEQEATTSPIAIEITALKEELKMLIQPIEVQITNLKAELSTRNSPIKVQIEKLGKEEVLYKNAEKKQALLAPTDGVIGNIHCKEAEHITSFKTLITFYEQNPTLVEGFVHESLIVHVQVGDTLEVMSSLHPQRKCLGVITGMGTRIVEIPERLRKMPQIKNYGREVLIKIPRENNFLQKERVKLQLSRPIVSSRFWTMR